MCGSNRYNGCFDRRSIKLKNRFRTECGVRREIGKMKKRGLKLAGLMVGLVVFGGCAVNPADKSVTENVPEETEASEAVPENDTDGVENGQAQTGDMPSESSETAELSQEDYEELYAPVIDELNATIENGYDFEKEYVYLSEGLIERLMYGEKDTLPDEIGYWLEDYSGDGIPELLVGYSEVYETGEQEMHIEDYIAGVYTIKDGKPVMTIEGWARNSYRLMDEGHFFNIGSGGAMNTIIGECHLSEDGTEVIWDEFCFTEGRADGSIAVFTNDSGIADREVSEEMDIGEEEFSDIMGEYELRCELIAWLPVRGYGHEKDDIDQSYDIREEAMYLFEAYYSDPTEENWDKFIALAPKDAVLFIVTNPPAELKDLANSPVVIDKSAFDTVVAVALADYTELELEDGEVYFNENDEMLWNPASVDKLYSGSLSKGEIVSFRIVLPEGGPSRALNVYTPDADGRFLVTTLSGEWDQHSTFVTANGAE